MPQRGILNSKTIKKIKSPLKIYADFKSILVQEDNGKQNLDESYSNKYQKHIACSYDYKLVCVNENFNEYLKTYFREDAVYNFIDSMIEESKYWSDVIKKHFNKEFVRTKKQ